MDDAEKKLLFALRAVDRNDLGLTPSERRVLVGCLPRLAQILAAAGVKAPYPLRSPVLSR